MKKYIFVTGGVCSSLGKGIASASIGMLLESRGLNVHMLKIDPYINVDAGTMSPYQHGEVYVTDDGAETDLDLGNYARFTSSPLSQENSITTGQVYQEVIKREREGRYLGRTVQVIPHITDEIKRRIRNVGESEGADVTITEIGGTVGDIESIPFLEAVRQLKHDFGKENVCYVHLTLVPSVSSGEMKTKPTQHSVGNLREIGIQPDVLLCRADSPVDESLRRKIALFTNVELESVISAYDVKDTIYEIPLVFREQSLDEIIVDRLGLPNKVPHLKDWEKMVDTLKNAEKVCRIALVGKYIKLEDSYKSVDEALIHGGVANGAKIEFVKLDSDKVLKQENLDTVLGDVDGLLIPGGFGQRGIEGMVRCAEYARVNKIPCFGICLGLQVMVIEYSRNVLGFADANSTEFGPDSQYPVISLLEEQIDVKAFGGTMRLGANESHLVDGSIIRDLYSQEVVHERHRHRYEVSNVYRERLEEAGLHITAYTPDQMLVESVQWPDHPWGLGVQFHPEFKSMPTKPHPLFQSFIAASLKNAKKG
ncbi:MAG: CTP synthase [Spirochaetia bacterium]